MAEIINVADKLESQIRSFLETHPNGGKFVISDLGAQHLVIPLMIATFNDEGWSGEYGFDENSEWIHFSMGAQEEEHL